ncbi:MAG TPA: CDP-glucose 4,6-dehydratase [Gammaproteobacteria bacterium]|nr:CDP-glucose 4,6-dehydratase [Gammaproteobacteria bacterium]
MISNISHLPDAEFWQDKRVLVTGHTGFKGGWLTLWLQRMGAQVTGLSMAPVSDPNLFQLASIDSLCESVICDVRNQEGVSRVIGTAAPEIVLHLAAQSLVRESYLSPIDTFSTNVMGTGCVLDAVRKSASVRVVVVITTDKVYRNNEWVWPYREGDRLGGYDPYSASKAASEILIDSYRSSFLAEDGKAVSSARAGNVIGGGDWSADRLIPDAMRAWKSGEALEIRRPNSIRPWQHVLEPLAGYLVLAETSWRNPEVAGAYNFGPETSEAAPVREVIDLARQAYGSGKINYGDGGEGPHEAGLLALDVAKSRSVLGVYARWSLRESVSRTMQWYLAQGNGSNVRDLCHADIDAYLTEERND